MEIYNGTYCVYAHINKVNGKIYIGQTCRKPEYRWNDGKGYKECTYFYNAIEKYGWDNFDHEILASNITKSEADNFEKLLIQKLDTMNPDIGYNLKAGGADGIFSEESKRKMSESHIGQRVGEKHPMYGKKHSDNAKSKISESIRDHWVDPNFKAKMHEVRKQLWEDDEYRQRQIESRTGKHVSEETRRKKSDLVKGEKNPMYGKHPSEETKRKMSESKKGVNNHNSRRVIQYDKDGNFIREWDYIKQAANELGICESSIGACCRHVRKSAGGFIWRYADEIDD